MFKIVGMVWPNIRKNGELRSTMAFSPQKICANIFVKSLSNCVTKLTEETILFWLDSLRPYGLFQGQLYSLWQIPAFNKWEEKRPLLYEVLKFLASICFKVLLGLLQKLINFVNLRLFKNFWTHLCIEKWKRHSADVEKLLSWFRFALSTCFLFKKECQPLWPRCKNNSNEIT